MISKEGKTREKNTFQKLILFGMAGTYLYYIVALQRNHDETELHTRVHTQNICDAISMKSNGKTEITINFIIKIHKLALRLHEAVAELHRPPFLC